MKKIIPLTVIILVTLAVITVKSQVQAEDTLKHSKSLYGEFIGAGSFLSLNYDFRLNKGRTDGIGLRFGAGGGGVLGSTIFTIPVEMNYIFSKKRFSFETGFSLTYANITNRDLFSDSESKGEVLFSYIPLGFRLRPSDSKGFMLRFNIGPVINYGGPNEFYDPVLFIWGGLCLGYTFF